METLVAVLVVAAVTMVAVVVVGFSVWRQRTARDRRERRRQAAREAAMRRPAGQGAARRSSEGSAGGRGQGERRAEEGPSPGGERSGRQANGGRHHRPPTAAEGAAGGGARRPAAAAKPSRGFELAPLRDASRDAYLSEWEAVQSRFLNDAERAAQDAFDLLDALMRDRGYPVDDFDERADDLAVEHPRVVARYRVITRIADAHARGEARPEELRQAMGHCRALFGDLLRVRPSDHVSPRDDRP